MASVHDHCSFADSCRAGIEYVLVRAIASQLAWEQLQVLWRSSMLTPKLRSRAINPSDAPSVDEAASTTSHAKRARSETIEADTQLPDAPKLGGSLLLEVFTHKSLRAACNAHYGDNERLGMLGSDVLELVVTDLLYNIKPRMSAKEIKAQRSSILNEPNLDLYADLYHLRDELRCSPEYLSILRSPAEGCQLFRSYLGAVFIQYGPSVTQRWLNSLFQLSSDLVNEPRAQNNSSGAFGHESKRQKMESDVFVLPAHDPPPHLPLPAEPSGPPPPPPPPPKKFMNPLAPAQPSLAFLPLFNQNASQRGIAITYPATFSGPPHAGKWSVVCEVNGLAMGHGIGTSKQIAKEEAAKQAYFAMGWAPRG